MPHSVRITIHSPFYRWGRKLRRNIAEVKELAQGHSAARWVSQAGPMYTWTCWLYPLVLSQWLWRVSRGAMGVCCSGPEPGMTTGNHSPGSRDCSSTRDGQAVVWQRRKWQREQWVWGLGLNQGLQMLVGAPSQRETRVRYKKIFFLKPLIHLSVCYLFSHFW